MHFCELKIHSIYQLNRICEPKWVNKFILSFSMTAWFCGVDLLYFIEARHCGVSRVGSTKTWVLTTVKCLSLCWLEGCAHLILLVLNCPQKDCRPVTTTFTCSFHSVFIWYWKFKHHRASPGSVVGQSESTGQKKAVKLLEVTAVAEMVAKDLERKLNNYTAHLWVRWICWRNPPKKQNSFRSHAYPLWSCKCAVKNVS